MTVPREALLKVLALAACGAALLAGCAAPPGPSTSGGSTREIRTESDQTDTDRRARARFELAREYFSNGKMEIALDEVKQAIAAKSDMAEAYNLRGLIYSNLNEPRLAEESFRRALQLNGRDPDAMHNFGMFLCQQKRFADAEAQFAAALAQPQYRDVVRTLFGQGVCHARAGQLAEAERALQRAYELDSSNPFVAYNLTEVLYRRGDYDRARFYIRRVNLQRELSNAQTLWLAARVEKKLGNPRGVDEFGAQLKSRYPNSPESLAYERGRFDD
jgi:type IV pilus assembly protein PilF